ncbi:unnamed protein product [Prunus armeniaca]
MTDVQRFGMGGSSPKVYSFGPPFHSVGQVFGNFILLSIFISLVGYSATRIENSGDVGVPLNKPMKTG